MNNSLREQKEHGKKNFPFAMYHGRIPEWLGGYQLHFHKEFEIIFVTYGRGIISVQDKKYLCQKDDIVIIPPEQVHSIIRYKAEKIAYYNILFDFSFLEENPDSYCSRTFFDKFNQNTELAEVLITKKSSLHPKLFPILQNLIQIHLEDYTKNALLIKSFLFNIMHILKDQAKPLTQSPSALKKNERLKKIISYIQENFSDPITVHEVAELVDLSESRFMKMFKSQTGLTFIQYLNDLRLESAASELLQKNKSVTQISLDNGFESTSYFISLFKKKFGTSPAIYAKKL
ncbi:MAG: AraC family transcriptional regulator [Treponema sp.]|nr:AraC family transcriptional regulator [Treponema sp.]